MGLNASLTVVTAGEFRKYPRTNPTGLAQFDLGRSWGPLESALRTMAPPLDVALRGDRPAVEEFDDDWDAYDAFVTPALVRRIDAALTALPEDELVAALKAQGFAGRKAERVELLAFFGQLRAAYQEAAAQRAYLRIFIC